MTARGITCSRRSLGACYALGVLLLFTPSDGVCVDDNSSLNAYADMLSVVRSGVIVGEVDVVVGYPGGEIKTEKIQVEYAFSKDFHAIIQRAKSHDGTLKIIAHLVIDDDSVQLLRNGRRSLEVLNRPNPVNDLRGIPELESPPPLRAFAFLGYDKGMQVDRVAFVWPHLANRAWVQKRMGMLAQSSTTSSAGDTLVRFVIDEGNGEAGSDEKPDKSDSAQVKPTSEYCICIGLTPSLGDIALVKSIEWGPIGFPFGAGVVEERFSYRSYVTADGMHVLLPASWEVYERGNSNRVLGYDLIDARLNVVVDKDAYRIDADSADQIIDTQTNKQFGK